MVNLTRIYTRTGDAGRTRLSDNSETEKTDIRVEAYGTVDETNSAIAVAEALGGLPERVSEMLDLIRNEMFDVGADLSTPLQEDPEWPPLRIEQSSIDRIEAWCDELSDPLPNLRSFILPGGSPPGHSCTWHAPSAVAPSVWPGAVCRPMAPRWPRSVAPGVSTCWQ